MAARDSTTGCGDRCGSATCRSGRRPSPRHASRWRGRRACGGSPAGGRRRKPGTSTRVSRACRSRRPAGRRGRGPRRGGGWRTSRTSWPRSSPATSRRSISIASGSWTRAAPSCSTIRPPTRQPRRVGWPPASACCSRWRGWRAPRSRQPWPVVGDAVRRRARRGTAGLVVRGRAAPRTRLLAGAPRSRAAGAACRSPP